MFHRNFVWSFFILCIFIYVECISIELNQHDESYSKELIRQKRQLTIPELVNGLGIFLGQLLTFVSNLLFVLSGSLPVILGALGLGGLGIALGIIVAQLGLIVQILSGKKRRALINRISDNNLTYEETLAKVTQAQTAAINLNNLTIEAQKLNLTNELNLIQTKLETLKEALISPNPILIEIQTSLNNVLSDLNNVVDQIRITINNLTNRIYSYIPTISQGLSAPLNYLSGLGSTLGMTANKHRLQPITLILENISVAQNETIFSLTTLDFALFTITNYTIGLLQFSTLQLGDTTVQGLNSCIPTIVR